MPLHTYSFQPIPKQFLLCRLPDKKLQFFYIFFKFYTYTVKKSTSRWEIIKNIRIWNYKNAGVDISDIFLIIEKYQQMHYVSSMKI